MSTETDQFRAQASIEVTAKHALETADIATLFPRNSRVYLADLGTHSVDSLVAASKRLADSGYRPIPHMAARRMHNESDIDNRLARFLDEGGAEEFLAVAGSPERQVGPFESSLKMLETGLFEKHGVKKLVVAGHPEGSPDFSDDLLLPSLKTKQEYGARTGTEITIATQFSFDSVRIQAWADELKQEDIDRPIHIGVAGPAKLTSLIRYAALCGVGQSLSFLKKRAGALTALATTHAPDDVVEPLERWIAENPDGLIKQIHVFPFGGIKKSSEWLIERGNWSLNISDAA